MLQRRVNSDADRERIRRFFADHLQDKTGFPLLDRADDFRIGVPSILRVIEDDNGDLVAAVYASNNPEDVVRWRSNGEDRVADVVRDQMLMIHKLAVMPAARRLGLGRQLIGAIIDDGLASRAALASVLFDDTQLGLRMFYEDIGFQVHRRAARLEVQFADLPGQTVGFPQDNPTYCWAVRVLDSRRARC